MVWPVPLGAEHGLTRPTRLVEGLLHRGLKARSFVSHGRHRTSGKMHGAPASCSGRPWVTCFDDRTSVLTPLVTRLPADTVWADMYDDWSLSPLINPLARMLAKRTYSRLNGRVQIATVNTEYMRLRVGGEALVVPNGCDPYLAHAAVDDAPSQTVLVLGSLDRKRTDGRTISRVLEPGLNVEFRVAGPGTAALAYQARASGYRVFRADYLALPDIASKVQSSTIAWLPLRVCDYTMSQDPMKLYAFLALGLRVVMPYTLIPSHLRSHRDIFAYENPDDGRRLIADLSHQAHKRTALERAVFAKEHSWEARCDAIVAASTV